ncbi:methylaspartate mutase [Streptosporangium sp. KLBMP 9127]|nr:methylaspartate mutase [Streptosporangium sp. KLBMP 9127]
MSGPAPGFGATVVRAHRAGGLVVQPRMGFGDPVVMRTGLAATRAARAITAGTITVDSYTRTGDLAAARRALHSGQSLNGYPIATHDPATTRLVLTGLLGEDFPVQVRHGSACPRDIVEGMIAAGLTATEGGPVSYCLPYGRTDLACAVRNWAACAERLAELRGAGAEPHLETFGGCMMGQLCPPGLLIALSVLEGMFFVRHGLRSVSLSYAQQTNAEQDREALSVLRRLAEERLGGVDWHVVVYSYMGLFPRTRSGAEALLAEAARLAVAGGAARLVVKTTAEAYRIPTIAENVRALETAARAAATADPGPPPAETGLYEEARLLVEGVCELDDDLGRALVKAFRLGRLDVPYCLHPDNARRSASFLDGAGRLRWAATGRMPIRPEGGGTSRPLTAAGLLDGLSYLRRKYDEAAPA